MDNASVEMLLFAANAFFGGNAPEDMLDLTASIGFAYLLVNMIVLLADGRYNRALHDRIAGTKVIIDR